MGQCLGGFHCWVRHSSRPCRHPCPAGGPAEPRLLSQRCLRQWEADSPRRERGHLRRGAAAPTDSGSAAHRRRVRSCPGSQPAGMGRSPCSLQGRGHRWGSWGWLASVWGPHRHTQAGAHRVLVPACDACELETQLPSQASFVLRVPGCCGTASAGEPVAGTRWAQGWLWPEGAAEGWHPVVPCQPR